MLLNSDTTIFLFCSILPEELHDVLSVGKFNQVKFLIPELSFELPWNNAFSQSSHSNFRSVVLSESHKITVKNG